MDGFSILFPLDDNVEAVAVAFERELIKVGGNQSSFPLGETVLILVVCALGEDTSVAVLWEVREVLVLSSDDERRVTLCETAPLLL